MKPKKLNFENFSSEVLSKKQQTTILGKGGSTTLPEIDEDGNIITPPTVAPGPGDGTSSGNGDGKKP